MIKLFGWEPRVKEQIKERREEELEYLRKARMMQYVNNSTTFVEFLFYLHLIWVSYTPECFLGSPFLWLLWL